MNKYVKWILIIIVLFIAIPSVIISFKVTSFLSGFFIDTTYRYVNRAERYIHEKYDDMEVKHVLIRGDENGYTTTGGYYTHWTTVDEPIVEFFVGESDEIGDNYELVLLELEMIKKATEHFNKYIDGDIYIESHVGHGGYRSLLPLNEYINLEQFIELSGQHFEKSDWDAGVSIHINYEGVKDISAEEMLLICKELNDSELLGYEPRISIAVERFNYINDENGNKIVNIDQLYNSGRIYPNIRYESPKEEFIEDYNADVERSAN